MSAVNITNVTVLDNPASFLTPFQFEISYECVSSLKDGMYVCLYIYLFTGCMLIKLVVSCVSFDN